MKQAFKRQYKNAHELNMKGELSEIHQLLLWLIDESAKTRAKGKFNNDIKEAEQQELRDIGLGWGMTETEDQRTTFTG